MINPSDAAVAIKTALVEAIDRDLVIAQLYDALYSIIEKACAKTGTFRPTKRIATALGAEFPGYRVHWENTGDMFHVVVWGNGIEFSYRLSFLVGYKSDQEPTVETFTQRCAFGPAAKERIDAGRRMLVSDVPKIVAAYEKLHAACGELKNQVRFGQPRFYTVLNALGVDSQLLS